MKIALGMIIKNEEKMLRRNFPKLAPYFDGFVIGDESSTDNSIEVISESCKDVGMGVVVVVNDDEGGYAGRRNHVIQEAEMLGYDGLVFLDADECMFPEDIEKIKERLKTFNAIMLPRYEFGPDDQHYNPIIYPDYQGRAFRLFLGYEYRNPLHEILYINGEDRSVHENHGFYASNDTHVYHYGRCKTPQEIWLRYHNYDRMKKGLEIIDTIPEGINFDVSPNYQDVIKFEGKQP